MAADRSSRLPGFYKRSPSERRDALRQRRGLTPEEVETLRASALSEARADLMVENVVGTFGMPQGIGVNFLINGEDVLIPMVVEEPSVVAAVSNMARLVRRCGGFQADSDASVMIGQIQVTDLVDADAASARLENAFPALMAFAQTVHPRLVARGGGVRGMEVRRLTYDEPGEAPEEMVVLHVFLDCVDAMGANMVNTLAERLAPQVEAIAGGRVRLRILSNLASRRLSRARCRIPPDVLTTAAAAGADVIDGICGAYRFAWADPWRAATHNKGVMNGIDAVALATGNDWRAIEAGAHAWAARDGQYRSLTSWKTAENGDLLGFIELPLQIGTVGGSIKNHPAVATNLKILGQPRARELSGIMAAVGLAQNLGALRALATEGIQKGHMRMHARNVALQAGAHPDEIPAVVTTLCDAQDYSVDRARLALSELRAS
ncbi:MAG: hydroxymethylglutaryl-CoA reductase, degradative [Myxococcota bacterium]